MSLRVAFCFHLSQSFDNHAVYRIADVTRSVSPSTNLRSVSPSTNLRSDSPPASLRSVAPTTTSVPRAERVGSSASSVSHSGGDVCAVCMDETPNCVLVPCGHTSLCYTCAITILISGSPYCPICRHNIEGVNETR